MLAPDPLRLQPTKQGALGMSGGLGGASRQRGISMVGESTATAVEEGAAGGAANGGGATSDPDKNLFDACRNGDLTRVRKLLANGYNVNAKNTPGRKSTPLHFAAGFGRREVVELLLNRGASVTARDEGGLIPLHNACSFGHAEVVLQLLKARSDPNALDNWKYSPLHEAASKAKADVCIVLLQVRS